MIRIFTLDAAADDEANASDAIETATIASPASSKPASLADVTGVCLNRTSSVSRSSISLGRELIRRSGQRFD